MNTHQKHDANELRETLFECADYRCLVSGEWLRDGVPQLAHRVINSKANRSKYGDLLHHPFNLAPVNSLAHNSAVIIHGDEAEELMEYCRITPNPSNAEIREVYGWIQEKFQRKEI